jgi:hypothetical protein
VQFIKRTPRNKGVLIMAISAEKKVATPVNLLDNDRSKEEN